MGKLNFTVTKEQTAGFAKAWDSGGIKVILDSTTIQFATDWANIVLKSFVADMAAQVKKVAEAKIAATAPTDAVTTQTPPVPAAPAAPSKIFLTD